jgi:SAM-dependent methyltransferase
VFTVTVDRQRLSSIAHSHHPIAAPVFGVNVNRLLRRAGRQPTARILDLGCGEAAWAMQALAHCPDGHADCVDVSPYALERGAAAAADRGLADRLTLHEIDARRYWPDGDYDLVLCVGSTHVFGGFAETMRQAGWTPVYAHVSDTAEWDNYEWSWVGLSSGRWTTPATPTPPGRSPSPETTATSGCTATATCSASPR